MKIPRLLCMLCMLIANPMHGQEKQSHTQTILLMGSRFGLTAVHENPEIVWTGIHAGITEIARIEKLISSWDEASQTSAINRMAGIEAVQVDAELFHLIERSLKVSGLTNGAFDISFASMDRIWKFDGSMTSMPPSEQVAQAASRINYQNIVLDRDRLTVFLREKGMRIGFGAIGKGYAANRAKAIMQKLGIKDGLVNAAGDLIAWGKMEMGDDWKIAIADPVKKGNIIAWLAVQEGAVVTSGDYERFAILNGKRYSHIIDPRTGYPTTGTKSVTIVCPDPELADALATSVFVLGPDAGLALIDQLRGIECLIITDENELRSSKNLKLQYEGEPTSSLSPTQDK